MTPARREELDEELPEIAKHTSEMERRADEAERELLQWKKVRFMADKVGDEYEGYITGVAPFGLFIELIEHYVEGLVHISSMADDYYRFVEQQHMLHGENTKKVYRLGDKVRVQVVRVDMERRQVDLGLVEILEPVRRDERARGPQRRSVRTETDGTESGNGGKRSARVGASGRRGRAAAAAAAGVARTSRSSRAAAVLRRVLEIPDAPADAPADLGQPVGAEDQDDDRQDDDQLRNAKVHMSPSAPIVPRMIRGIIAVAVLVRPGAGWADTGLFAQFSSGVQLIEVYATVTDANGELVTGLRQSDFQVFENDRPQEISAFAAGEFPLTVALGVDRSFSMAGEPLRLAKLASQTLLEAAEAGRPFDGRGDRQQRRGDRPAVHRSRGAGASHRRAGCVEHHVAERRGDRRARSSRAGEGPPGAHRVLRRRRSLQ